MGKSTEGKDMSSRPSDFSFRYFESLPDAEIVPAAKRYLESKYPPNSLLAPAVEEIRKAGGHCENATDRGEHFVFCKFIRPGHGLMALVSSIEWQIGFYTDVNYLIITKIEVGRGATGM
jgi:hypothetical protein